MIFLAFYTIEAVFKIVGSGFILGYDAYLRDKANILDFIVVISA
jgi:hypothetical protein